MQQNIEKELLLARLNYLQAINDKPGSPEIHSSVFEKVKEYIISGRIGSYMGVESLFNHLVENLADDESRAEELANELIAFIDL
jgi:hypothetical protein